jgi:dTDP-4-dehydrorhamnose reductase
VHRPGAALGQLAPRPPYSALCSERATLLPSLEDALRRYLLDLEAAPTPPPGLQAAA